MRLPEEADSSRSGVNILPMIDVIFAILAFFVLSTLYLTRAEGLPVNLPQAVTATPQNQVNLTLTIIANAMRVADRLRQAMGYAPTVNKETRPGQQVPRAGTVVGTGAPAPVPAH